MDESVNIGNLSKVEYLSEHEKYRCGYCGLSDSNYSHGMWAYMLTVEDYQALIDRGWRRSGKYVYKPTMDLTCCPQYTVRCKANQFKIRDSHKKVIKKFNNFINTGVKCARDKMEVVVGSQPQHNEFRQPLTVQDLSDNTAASAQAAMESGDKNTDGLTHSTLVSSSSSVSAVTPACSIDAEASLTTGTKMEEGKKAKSLPKPGVGLDPSKPTCRKGKLVRHEKWLKKQAALGKSQNVSKKESGPISIGDRLNKISDNPMHKFEMRLVRSNPRSQLFNETFDESYAVYKKYQMLIHNDPPEKPTEKQYTRFLVDSPLKAKCGEGSPTSGYGSFHQHYLLDGKIIAVGVIDILPKCVSSVYLYYDPDYSFLSLGTYSALREVSFIQELSALQPSIEYYYMGFYIHTCPKMKYKGQYTPSYLLCPETYKWSPMEKCSRILDTVKYSRFEESSSEEEESKANLDNLICVYSRYPLRYSSVEPILAPSCKTKVREYSTLVGLECAQRMVLILQ